LSFLRMQESRLVLSLDRKYRKDQEKSDCLRLLGKYDYTIQYLPISTIVGLRTLVIFRGERAASCHPEQREGSRPPLIVISTEPESERRDPSGSTKGFLQQGRND
jgi:hypothetical protein